MHLDKRQQSRQSPPTGPVTLTLARFTVVFEFLTVLYPESTLTLPIQLLTLGATLVAFVISLHDTQFKAQSDYGAWILVTGVLVLTQFWYTSFKFDQNAIDFFRASHTMLLCLWAFIMASQMKRQGHPTDVLDPIVSTVSLLAAFAIIATFAKSEFGISLIQFNDSWIRSGRVRAALPSTVGFAAVYLTYRVISTARDRLRIGILIQLGISVFASTYVGQSRVTAASVWVGMLVVWILSAATPASARARLFAVLLLTFAGFAKGWFSDQLSTLSFDNADFGASSAARLLEFRYYFAHFVSTPLTGMGLLSVDGPHSYLLRGPFGWFYAEDIGIVGTMGAIGLLGGLLVIFPVVRGCMVAAKDLPLSPLVGGLSAWLIVGLLTLSQVYPVFQFSISLVVAVLAVCGRSVSSSSLLGGPSA